MAKQTKRDSSMGCWMARTSEESLLQSLDETMGALKEIETVRKSVNEMGLPREQPMERLLARTRAPLSADEWERWKESLWDCLMHFAMGCWLVDC